MRGALAAILLLASGCGAWTRRDFFFVPAIDEKARATQPAAIEFYFLKRPERTFRVLGTIFTENRDVGALRAEAALRGCHALLLQTPPRYFPAQQACIGWEAPKIQAVCVRYVDE